MKSSIYTPQPDSDSQISTCARLNALSLASPSALVCSLLSCHHLCLQQSALLSLSFTLSPQQQRPMSTGVTLSHSHPTTVKHLPKISRHIACGAAEIQRCADTATRQVAARISNEKLPTSKEYFSKSSSVCEAVNEQFITSDVIKHQTDLMSKKEMKKGLLR